MRHSSVDPVCIRIFCRTDAFFSQNRSAKSLRLIKILRATRKIPSCGLYLRCGKVDRVPVSHLFPSKPPHPISSLMRLIRTPTSNSNGSGQLQLPWLPGRATAGQAEPHDHEVGSSRRPVPPITPRRSTQVHACDTLSRVRKSGWARFHALDHLL